MHGIVNTILRVCNLVFTLLQLLLNSLLDEFHVFEALIIDTQVEELVEVEFVLHQESNVARLKLHHRVPKDVRVRPDICIERSRYIARLTLIPFVGANSNLERVHPLAIML